MNHTILVPLDASSWSEHALPIAAMLAHASGATVHLVHVYVPIVLVGGGGYRMGSIPLVDPSWNAERSEHARGYLAAQALKLSNAWGVTTTTQILDAPVVESLADHIQLTKPELIVMTTHGRGGMARLWLGSVADRLVHHSTRPILFVRPHDEAVLAQPAQPFKRVLVPLDGSPLAEQILEAVVQLGKPMKATFALVSVVESLVLRSYSPVGYVFEVAERATTAMRDDAQQYLTRVAKRLTAQGVEVTTRVIVADHVGNALLQDAQEHGVDLIAMATHGRGGLARMVIGSVADKVLRGADQPVLLYHPREENF